MLIISCPAFAATIVGYGFSSAPVIDASLNEWADVPTLVAADSAHVVWRPENWHGPDDCSLLVQLGNDSRFLYAALRVADDTLLSAENVTRGDHATLSVSIDAESGSGARVTSHAVFAAAPDGRLVLAHPQNVAGPLSGALAAAEIDATGYTLELRVDLAAIRPALWARPESLRVAASVHDFDVPDRPWDDCVVSTAPGWRWTEPQTYDVYAMADVPFDPPQSARTWEELWGAFKRAPVDWASHYDLGGVREFGVTVYRFNRTVRLAGYHRTANDVRLVGLLDVGTIGYGMDEGTPGGTPLRAVRLPDRSFGFLVMTSSPSATFGPCSGGTEDSLIVLRLDQNGFARLLADLLASCAQGITEGRYELSPNPTRVSIITDGYSGSNRRTYEWKSGRYIRK